PPNAHSMHNKSEERQAPDGVRSSSLGSAVEGRPRAKASIRGVKGRLVFAIVCALISIVVIDSFARSSSRSFRTNIRSALIRLVALATSHVLRARPAEVASQQRNGK